MPERLECEVLQKARYINTLTFTFISLLVRRLLKIMTLRLSAIHNMDIIISAGTALTDVRCTAIYSNITLLTNQHHHHHHHQQATFVRN